MSKGSRRNEQQGKHRHVNKYASKSMTAGEKPIAEILLTDPTFMDRACAEAVAKRDRVKLPRPGELPRESSTFGRPRYGGAYGHTHSSYDNPYSVLRPSEPRSTNRFSPWF